MNRILIVLAAFFCSCASGSAQFFSIGLKGGLPLTDAYDITQNCCLSGSTYQRLYIIGPTAEAHFPFHLGIEIDALYRRDGFQTSGTEMILGGLATVPVLTSGRTNDWQFPLLAKWAPGKGPVRLFVDGGVTFRHVSDALRFLITSPHVESGGAFPAQNPNSAGVSVGVGLTVNALILRISPEIRYTHWTEEPFIEGGLQNAYSTSNQADLLVGITF